MFDGKLFPNFNLSKLSKQSPKAVSTPNLFDKNHTNEINFMLTLNFKKQEKNPKENITLLSYQKTSVSTSNLVKHKQDNYYKGFFLKINKEQLNNNFLYLYMSFIILKNGFTFKDVNGNKYQYFCEENKDKQLIKKLIKEIKPNIDLQFNDPIAYLEQIQDKEQTNEGQQIKYRYELQCHSLNDMVKNHLTTDEVLKIYQDSKSIDDESKNFPNNYVESSVQLFHDKFCENAQSLSICF